MLLPVHAVPRPMPIEQQDLLLGALNTDGPDLAQLRQMDAPARLAALGRADRPFALGLRQPDGSAFMAVDRFAVHTLCWRIQDGRLRFAERADELCDPGHALDPQALFDYLYFHAIPSPRTVWQGVFRLPPGHCAVFENGRISVTPYWRPEFAPARDANFATLKDEFRTLLREATTAQLDGSRPACFLSGGTDSSTVAGMIGLAAARSAAGYSIGFEAEGYDEMAYARLAAKHFGCVHREYYVTPADLVQSIPGVAQSYDQPFGNSSAVPAFWCAKMARDDGITRILAGDGGDELFGGNKRYATQRVFNVWDQTPAPLRAVLGPLLDNDLARRVPGVQKAGSYIRQASVPLPDRLQTYNLLQRLGTADVLTPGFLARVDSQGPQNQQRDVWHAAHNAGLLDRQLAFDWRYTLADNDLPKVCGTTRLAGLEVGFPMLDRRLVDFSLHLPTHYKLKGLKLRWFFKEALRGFLPDEIITKKKQGFGLPFGVWAVRDAKLQALARDSLGSLSTRGIVRADFIRQLLDHKLAEHPGYYGEMVWILMMLEQWLQRFAPGWREPG
jgi:asparagine synthase (glutamine-hydrolysing)